MDTPEVQRLRRVRQLGVTSLAFPGAEHTRFAPRDRGGLRDGSSSSPASARSTAISVLASGFDRPGARRRSPPRSSTTWGMARSRTSSRTRFRGRRITRRGRSESVLDPSTGVHKALAGLDPQMPSRVAALVRGRTRAPVPGKGGQWHLRCRPLRLPPPRRAREPVFATVSSISTGSPPQSPGFAPVAADPNDALSSRIDGAKGLPAIEAFILGPASSCSSRCISTRRRGRPSG